VAAEALDDLVMRGNAAGCRRMLYEPKDAINSIRALFEQALPRNLAVSIAIDV